MESCVFEEIVKHGLVIALRDLRTGRIIPMISGSDDADPDKDKEEEEKPGKDDKPEDEATAREGDGKDDEGEDDKDDDADQDAADPGEKGNVGLKKRLSKVSARLRAYKTHGTPEEYAALKAEVAKYKKYEKEIEDDEKKRLDEEARKKGQPTIAEQNARFDKILDQRYGEGAAEDFEAFRETRNGERARHVRDGFDHLKKLLVEHGLEAQTKGEAFEAWDQHIGAALRKTPERWARFKNPITELDAIDEAFKDVKRFLVDPAVAATSAGKIKSLQRRRDAAPSSAGRGAAPNVKQRELKPPDNLKGPARQAWWDKALEEVSVDLDDQPDA